MNSCQPGVFPLEGAVQHYEWGGHDFIPGLLRIENKEAKPFAELWIGAHPMAPATAWVGGAALKLDRLLEEAPEAVLGPAAARRFAGRLPYLLKILDAHQMLSIQAHPNKRQAAEGFARENAAGIPLDAPQRNYRDHNHKPELQVALTDFWMLHGFRGLEQIAETLGAVPELTPVMPEFAECLEKAGEHPEARRRLLRELYAAVITMPQRRVDAILEPLIARLAREEPWDRDAPDFWALRAAEHFPLPAGHRDRGIFSIYLLNLLGLAPGQGTFQPAGVLHAYLEGANVEVMANSDNVLRGGLTPKHVDVDELLRTLTFDSGAPAVLEGQPLSPTDTVYRAPVEEFELSRIKVGPGKAHSGRAAHGPHTLIVLEGCATLTSEGRTVVLDRGTSVLVCCGIDYAIQAARGPALLFKAAIPVANAATGP
jgi:mannose-6-phosphate isomerase